MLRCYQAEKDSLYRKPVKTNITTGTITGGRSTITEQIKVLCVRSNISIAELARRLGKSPQAFNAKMKRESFTAAELELIADAVDAKFIRHFEISNGEKI